MQGVVGASKARAPAAAILPSGLLADAEPLMGPHFTLPVVLLPPLLNDPSGSGLIPT